MKYGKWWGVKEWYATAMYFRAGRLGRICRSDSEIRLWFWFTRSHGMELARLSSFWGFMPIGNLPGWVDY